MRKKAHSKTEEEKDMIEPTTRENPPEKVLV